MHNVLKVPPTETRQWADMGIANDAGGATDSSPPPTD